MSLLSVLYRCKHVCMYLREYAWIQYIISTDNSNSITCYFIIIKTRPPNNYLSSSMESLAVTHKIH